MASSVVKQQPFSTCVPTTLTLMSSPAAAATAPCQPAAASHSDSYWVNSPSTFSAAQGTGFTSSSTRNHDVTPSSAHAHDLRPIGRMGGSGFFPRGHPPQGNHGQGWVNPNWSLNNNLPKPFLDQAPPLPQPFIVRGHCLGMPYFYPDARPIAPPVHGHVTRSHHPPVHVPPHPQLSDRILKQIEYYFSHENLVKDIFLRGKMDDEGWVPINLIAGFKKVKELTDNIHIILDSLKHSGVVQVKGEKIRRQNDWNKWLLPHSFDVTSLSRSVSSDSLLSEDHQHSPS